MSCTIKNNVIKITQGDTLVTKINITDADGEEYVPVAEDSIRFAVKKEYTDKTPLIVKAIPWDTLVLRLETEDTSLLKIGEYRYDIEITLSDGTVSTIIPWQKMIVTEQAAT